MDYLADIIESLGKRGEVALTSYASDMRGQTTLWKCTFVSEVYQESRIEIDEIGKSPTEAVDRVSMKVASLTGEVSV